METMATLFRNGIFVTCDPARGVVSGDLLVSEGRIVALGPGLSAQDAQVVCLRGAWVYPGFVQSHVHLCQTLFRGMADDLILLDWLRKRIWPLEAAHDLDSMYWSARLGVTELLLGGTTAILDMGTVHHLDGVFHACAEAGIRATSGRALMDRENEAGLSQDTNTAIQGACDEADRWHGKDRLAYAFAPRFVPSCTERLLREVVEQARVRGCLIHTHASESLDEVALVRELTGRDNVVYLNDLGMTGPDVGLAHCIHLTPAERALLARTGTRVLHCPSSNLKLGSGIAPIPELLQAGVHVSLGADGAPCNNRMDIFTEMRLAALIQKPRLGPEVMPASQVLHMATVGGAQALGLTDCGSLAIGNQADLVVVEPDAMTALPSPDPVSAAVYSLTPAAVRSVWIGGDCVVRDGSVVGWSTPETVRGAKGALARVRERAQL
jgi:cytosine/adenosine deaminase-related metal-dependent hydrolase